jgi:hypothetical protein
MITLTAKEVGNAVGLSAAAIKKMRRNNVITGELRGNQLFFNPDVISVIKTRNDGRGKWSRKAKKEKVSER